MFVFCEVNVTYLSLSELGIFYPGLAWLDPMTSRTDRRKKRPAVVDKALKFNIPYKDGY